MYSLKCAKMKHKATKNLGYLIGKVENVVEATYFANMRGDCTTLPDVRSDNALT